MLLEPKTELDKYSGCPDLPHTLLAICDISADLGVSILSRFAPESYCEQIIIAMFLKFLNLK